MNRPYFASRNQRKRACLASSGVDWLAMAATAATTKMIASRMRNRFTAPPVGLESQPQAECDAAHRSGNIVPQEIGVRLCNCPVGSDLEVCGLIHAGELGMIEGVIRLRLENEAV